MAKVSQQIEQARAAFAEAPDERARMGRISGALWMCAALIGTVDLFLPGAEHAAVPAALGVAAAVFLYGLASVTGWIPWERASIDTLAIGMVVTIPVVALAIYLTGGSLSYIEPLLVFSLLYAAFFFPERWAWPLTIELILFAGAPLIYDPDAIGNAFLPRYLGLAVAFLGATWVMVGLKKRLVAAEVRQREFANRDPLTGVGNRRHFDATLERELRVRRPAGASRPPKAGPLALLAFDLDDFKEVNDRHGHLVGDTVLQIAAERMQAVLGSTGTLARIGGDEFAIVLPGGDDRDAAQMAAVVCAAVAGEGADGHVPPPSTSVGWAVFPDDADDFEGLMRCADARMLRSKRGVESGSRG